MLDATNASSALKKLLNTHCQKTSKLKIQPILTRKTNCDHDLRVIRGTGKETKPSLKDKCESMFDGRHMDNVSKEIPEFSVMTLH